MPALAVPVRGYPIVTWQRAAALGDEEQIYSLGFLADGTLVIGGNKLYHFDGDRWECLDTGKARDIAAIEPAPDGKMWIAADGEAGWLDRDTAGAWKYHSISSFIPSADQIRGQTWKILHDGLGAVFVTADVVYRFDGAKVASWRLPGARHLGAFRIGGSIYITHTPSGIYRMQDDGPHLAVSQSEIGDPANALVLGIQDFGDSWIVVTGQGLVRVNEGKGQQIAPATSTLLSQQKITCAVRLPGDRLAFGTLKGGIYITDLSGSILEQIDAASGFGGYVNGLAIDPAGMLWSVGSDGVACVNVDPNTRAFDKRAGLSGTGFRAVAMNRDVVAVSGGSGLFQLEHDAQQFRKNEAYSTPPSNLSTIGDRIVATGIHTVWEQVGKEPRVLATSTFDFITAEQSRTADEILVAQTEPALVSIDENGNTRSVVGQIPSWPSSFALDSDGNIWIGTFNAGLFVARSSGGTISSIAVKAGEPTLDNRSGWAHVVATATRDILVFTETGVWVKSVGSPSFTQINDFPRRPITAISRTLPNDSVWIAFGGTSDFAPSIAVLEKVDQTFRILPHHVSGLESVAPVRAIQPQLSENGSTVLWMAGSTLIRHVVGREPHAVAPASPLLNGYVLSGTGSRRGIATELSYATHGVGFKFSQPQLADRAQIHLQTKIDGIDADWIPANKDSTRELTAIRDGTYKFQVRAVAETGLVSEPTVFTFTVLPPWWRTKLALWLEGIALVGLIAGGVQWRVRTLRKRNLQLEQKVEARTAELKEANAAKTQFVANMSHDIRNPLSGIVGLTLALEDTRLDAQQREIVSTLRECTSYLSTLVDDVLDFASIEAGKIELHPAPFVPAEVLNSVVTALKAQCAEKNAFVTIETDPEIPHSLLGDAGRIQQILVNYLSNALKYGGGHIRVCASLAQDSVGEIEFAVADEGPGLTEADKTRLFTQFNRLDAARRSHIKGTGLGLAACRFLADAMGGSVGVDSEVGHGSRFFLRLPLVQATTPVVVDDSLALPPTSVLLVEDTDYNALAASAVLKKLGLTCDRAANGAEAIKLFTEKRHHIVLLDRNLPDMDGTEVAARIRELETDGLHAMIFAVTAYCTAEDKQKCLAAGMDAFVGKPLTPEKLRRTLLAAATQVLGTGTVAAPGVGTPSAQATSEPTLPNLDTSLLEYLAEGTPGGLALQVDRFIEALRETHAELLRIEKEGDPIATGNAAHRVLGHARMVNAADFTNDVIALEAAARAGERDRVAALLPVIARHVDAVTAALRRRPGVLRA